jgi:hypothetical protein
VASKSYPRAGYNSGTVTSLEHERLVSPQAPDGLVGHPDDLPMVYADGTGTRAVKIRANRYAVVRGTQYDSGTSDITMSSLAANSSGQPRIDRIVLRLNRTDYTITETAITGTPAASPSAPALTQDTGSTGFFDIPLARVAVANGATAITSGNVTEEGWYLSESGVNCKTTTRPLTVIEGLMITEVDTNTIRVGVNDQWLLVGDDSATSAISLNAGFTASHNFLRRRNGWVMFSLTVARNTLIGTHTNVTVGTIPAGFRPAQTWQFNATSTATQVVVTTTVNAAGAVGIGTGATSQAANQSMVFSPITYPLA